jgi:thymidylate kinase
MSAKRGLLIVLEGLDRSGKTSHAKLLVKSLKG